MSHNNLEPQHKNAWGLTRHTSIKLSLSSLYCHPTKDNTQLDSKQSSDFNHFSIILNHETKTHHQPTASMLPCYCSASEARISLLVPSFEVSNKSSPELSRHCTIPYAAAVYTCNMAAEKPTELLYYKSGKEVNLTQLHIGFDSWYTVQLQRHITYKKKQVNKMNNPNIKVSDSQTIQQRARDVKRTQQTSSP